MPIGVAVGLAALAVTIVFVVGRGGAPSRPVRASSQAPGASSLAPVTRVAQGRVPVRLARVGGAPASLVWAAGAVWVPNGRRVLRIDASTLSVATGGRVRGQCEDSQISAGLAAVWLVSGHCWKPGALSEINPATGRVVWQVRIPPIAAGVAPWVSARRLIVTTLEADTRWTLAEVNPATRRVHGLSGTLHHAIDSSGLTAVVATPSGFWAEPAGFGGIAHIIPHGKRVSGSVLYADRQKAGLAYGDGIVFAGLAGDVLQLDPASGNQTGRPLQPPGDITALAYGGNNAWIATSDGNLYRYPPGADNLALAARLPRAATSLAVGGRFLWAASFTTGRVARVGPIPTA